MKKEGSKEPSSASPCFSNHSESFNMAELFINPKRAPQ